MSYDTQSPTGTDVGFDLSGPWPTYWVAILRVVTGWWFFHAGVTKLLDVGLGFEAAGYLNGMSGTVMGPFATFLADLGFVGALVPVFETLIGLALMAGLLTRLAAFGGAFFMTMFWVGNAKFGHGVMNSDFMGLLLFLTVIVLAAGRYYGLDAIVERTDFVKQRPRLKYLLG
jgi:thiosulfate dehydrogenase [quinone] large subunit